MSPVQLLSDFPGQPAAFLRFSSESVIQCNVCVAGICCIKSFLVMRLDILLYSEVSMMTMCSKALNVMQWAMDTANGAVYTK